MYVDLFKKNGVSIMQVPLACVLLARSLELFQIPFKYKALFSFQNFSYSANHIEYLDIYIEH